MEPTFYADILFFAAVAAFIAYRLYTVLGRKDGTEQNLTHRVKEMWENKPTQSKKDAAPTAQPKPQPRPVLAPAPAQRIKPFPIPAPTSFENVSESAQRGIVAIMEKDRTFTAEHFLTGAQSAFEIILSAFAEGNKAHLKNLLSSELYGEFTESIDQRNAAGQTVTTILVALVRAEITGAKLEGSLATLTVSFESEQISCTRNAEGEVISGNPTVSERLYDSWVFERDLGSRNPTWLLIDTDAVE